MIGFVNKINKVLEAKMSLPIIEDMVATIKTVHTQSGGDAADIHDMNGLEIKKWVKIKWFVKLIAQTNDVVLKRSLQTFHDWSAKVVHYSTKVTKWEPEDFSSFEIFYADVKARWSLLLGCPPTPKVHIAWSFPRFRTST